TAPHGKRFLDSPDLLSLHGIPRDELALVSAGATLLWRIAADVRRARDVRDLAALEIHAEIVRRHVEQSRFRREGGRLLILSALETGTDVLDVLPLRRRLVDVDVRPPGSESDARRPVHRHEWLGEQHLAGRAIHRVREAVA